MPPEMMRRIRLPESVMKSIRDQKQAVTLLHNCAKRNRGQGENHRRRRTRPPPNGFINIDESRHDL